MAKKVFKSDLSAKGLEKLRNELLEYKRDYLQERVKMLVERLAESGVNIAKANITKLDAIFTGELMNSIKSVEGGSTKENVIFYIVADSEHAAFIEFGTGQMGEEAPYPYPRPKGIEWNYNSGKTIFEISPGNYGWFYPRDGKWYFTQGMPSRPFLYETSLELQQLIVKTAKEVFK